MGRISLCPSCGHAMVVRRLECTHCGTAIEGRFSFPFAGLDDDDLAFAERFVRARGNLKELERTLGLSYPSLRTRLDALVEKLGGEPPPPEENRRREVLELLARGEIDVAEAVRRLTGRGAEGDA
jgi:hypothetical protein